MAIAVLCSAMAALAPSAGTLLLAQVVLGIACSG